MVNLQWSINHMRVSPSAAGKENVVTEVHWEVKAIDGLVSERVYGSASVPFVQDGTFKPFDKLDENDVLDWVKGILGQDEVSRIEGAAEAQLKARLAPQAIDADLPWTKKNSKQEI